MVIYYTVTGETTLIQNTSLSTWKNKASTAVDPIPLFCIRGKFSKTLLSFIFCCPVI